MLDITERKMLELKVEENQRNLMLAERVAGLGHWQLDLETGQSQWSDTMYNLHGLDKSVVTPSLALTLERTHPEDRQAVTDAINAVKQSGARDVEHRIMLGDGEIRWLRQSGIYRIDEAGREIILVPRRILPTIKNLSSSSGKPVAMTSTPDFIIDGLCCSLCNGALVYTVLILSISIMSWSCALLITQKR